MDQPNPSLTVLLQRWANGDQDALERLTPLVYDELHRRARQYLAREQVGQSLQATALVNEAFLRLVQIGTVHWQDRIHFFALSAQLMRRILIDAARARRAGKRGGNDFRVTLYDQIAVVHRDDDLVRLDEALESLARHDARKARAIELRFFGGLSVEETAEVLQISPQSVLRDWTLARAWLAREMQS